MIEIKGVHVKKLFLVLAAVFLVGCANKPVGLTASFDKQAAEKQLQDGSNTVTGSALIRQAGGGVVTCAGGAVFLMPVTDRAREWAVHVYGTTGPTGYRSASGYGVSFDSSDPFFAAVRSATCDTQGAFKFQRVADGEFLVFTRITWRAGDSTQGGSVMRSIKLQGGEIKEIVLSPGAL